MAEFVKYNEIGISFDERINYIAKLENGMIRVSVLNLPNDFCIGFELVKNYAKVIDNYAPSQVNTAMFEIKNFGDYQVRILFYHSSDLNEVKYQFETIPFIFDNSTFIKTLNNKGYDYNDALTRFRRILFDEHMHQTNSVDLLTTLSQESDLGYSFVDYLIDKEITNIYLYCEERDWNLGRSFYHKLYVDPRINIKGCISDITFIGKKTDNYPMVDLVSVNYFSYEEDDVIILLSANGLPEVELEFIGRGLNVFNIQNLLKDTATYARVNYPYQKLQKKYPNVDLIFIKPPRPLSKTPIENRSENENEILAQKINLMNVANDLKKNPPKIPIALLECGVTLEEAKEFVNYRQDLDRKNDGYSKPVDRFGEYVNVVDGNRVTTGQPDSFRNIIYIYGKNFVFSPCTTDDKTAASTLQRLLNKKDQNAYKVVNSGGWSLSNITNMHRVMLDTYTYLTGDKIIIWADFLPDPDKLDYVLIDLETLFDRPHAHGELVVAKSHYNEIAQKLVAEAIFDKLQKKKLLSNEKNAIRYSDRT